MVAGRRGAHPATVDYDGEQAGLGGIGAAFEAAVAAGAGALQPGKPHGAPADGGGDQVGPEQVWTGRLPPQQVTVAATIDTPDWGPEAGSGRVWRVSSIVIQLSGASSVSFYRNGVALVNLKFTATASGLWEPSALYLMPGDRLIAVAAGGGAVISGDIEQISAAVFARYLL